MPIQLQHRDEPRHHDPGLRDPGDQFAEAHRFGAAQQGHDDRRLLADAHERRMQMIEADVRDLLRSERQQSECPEVIRAQRPHELRRLRAVLLVEAHRADVPPVLALQAACEPGRDLFEGAVLQQAGEQQVARLEQRDSLRVHQLALRQEAGDLHVEQRRGHHQELGRLVQVLVVVEPAQVRDELVGDGAQRDFGDVHLVLRDEIQQQVERPVEVRQGDPEAGGLGRRRTVRALLERRVDGCFVRRRRHGRPAPAPAAGTPAQRRARARTR